jgi:phosphoglycolate phosphatase-like HAD superfamily hydrolase
MKEEACRAAVRGMKAAGLNMDEDEAYTQLMATYFKVGIESDIAFIEFLKSIGQFDHKILAAAINEYLKTKLEFAKPYPHVESVLQELQRRGIALAIVTDAPKTKAYQRLFLMGIESYFKFLVGSGRHQHGKKQVFHRECLELLRKEFPDLTNRT